MKKYVSTYCNKLLTEDNFNQGEIGASFEDGFDYVIAGGNLNELLGKISELTGATRAAIDVNPTGEEVNRISAYTLENEGGEVASSNEIEQWKAGEIKLFAVTWDFYFVEQKKANFNV